MKKFKETEYYKHKNSINAFIMVERVTIDSGHSAIIEVHWLVQGIFNFWFTPAMMLRHFIKEDQYDNWELYSPRGKLL